MTKSLPCEREVDFAGGKRRRDWTIPQSKIKDFCQLRLRYPVYALPTVRRRCTQTAAHAYATLYLPPAAGRNAALYTRGPLKAFLFITEFLAVFGAGTLSQPLGKCTFVCWGNYSKLERDCQLSIVNCPLSIAHCPFIPSGGMKNLLFFKGFCRNFRLTFGGGYSII